MTDNQRKYLESLVCERLSDHEANRALADKFVNTMNPRLAAALKDGWNADKKDKLAYYIVKDPDLDVPLLYFSLKCGELHTPLDPKKLDKSVNSALMLLREAAAVYGKIRVLSDVLSIKNAEFVELAMIALQRAKNVEVEEWAKEVIAKQLVDGMLPRGAWRKILRRAVNAVGRQISKEQDQELEGENIVRTKENYAAVELEHFCVYDNVPWDLFEPEYAKEHKKELQIQFNPVMRKWYEQDMGARTLAKTMFWKFVVPVIQDLRKLVGCEYVYLFAAENNGSRVGTLIDYYRGLGFDFQEKVYVHKPAYDFGCSFMCQKVTALRKQRNDFFKNYNKTK